MNTSEIDLDAAIRCNSVPGFRALIIVIAEFFLHDSCRGWVTGSKSEAQKVSLQFTKECCTENVSWCFLEYPDEVGQHVGFFPVQQTGQRPWGKFVHTIGIHTNGEASCRRLATLCHAGCIRFDHLEIPPLVPWSDIHLALMWIEFKGLHLISRYI